nr:hypothetical protein [Tanacetum cinerariifolium]
ALFDAYECDKLILDTYEDTVTLKRSQNYEDKDEDPSARSNRGSKRRREGKKLESTSTPKEKTSKTSSKSTEGSKSQHKIDSESAPAKEPTNITQDLEEPAPQVFKTGATDDQPIEEVSQHPHWFQKQAKPTTPYGAWNKTCWLLMDLFSLRLAICQRKLTLFYGFPVIWESARDVYCKRRIIAVTELQIIEWHNYKHLDWIIVRRDDDKLYKFKK